MKAKMLLAVVFLCGSFGLAQAQTKIRVFGGMGISIPTKSDVVFPSYGDVYRYDFDVGNIVRVEDVPDVRLADVVKIGFFNLSCGVGFFFGESERIGMRGTINYNTLPQSDEVLKRGVAIFAERGERYDTVLSIADESSLTLWNISLDVLMNLTASDSQVVPYLFSGLNLLRSSAKDLIIIQTSAGGYVEYNTIPISTGSGFGFSFGAGLSLHLTDRLGVSAEARYIFTRIRNESVIDDQDFLDDANYLEFGGYIPLKIECFMDVGSN